jgi:hypothetical protein
MTECRVGQPDRSLGGSEVGIRRVFETVTCPGGAELGRVDVTASQGFGQEAGDVVNFE